MDEEGMFAEVLARSIAAQVLEVLFYLGCLKPPVVHRDIKPANLVLDPDGQVRLVDFGAVKEAAARASTIGSTVAGTFGYMAPEVIYGTGEPRSDLYSLGMTLVTLLTGLAPTELPQKRLKPDFRGRTDATQPFLDFVERLVEPVPEDRFTDAREALGVLQDAIVIGTLESGTSDFGALVRARELKGRRAAQKAELAQRQDRDRHAARYAHRHGRVSVAKSEGQTRLVLEPKRWRDLLWEQAGWGFGFAFINPGVFIMMGLGAFFVLALDLSVAVGTVLTVVTWMVLLTLCNIAFAATRRRRWVLDVTGEHYALHNGNAARPTLLGSRTELSVDTSTPDPAELGRVAFDDPRGDVQVEKLTDRDLRAIQEGLSGVVKLS
jgi:hypothetical protein